MIARAPEAPMKRVPARALAAMAAQEPASLEALNAIIRASEPLVPGATQAVLGEGPLGADIAFVGEQPGDQEDVHGRPFVGPAGQLLSRALREAGIDRERTYLTNAVKHFKFEVRGKRRIHQKPGAGEVAHYRWWLERELAFVAPRLVVALGATAMLALSGRQVPITRARGPASFGDKPYRGFVTVHPPTCCDCPTGRGRTRMWASSTTCGGRRPWRRKRGPRECGRLTRGNAALRQPTACCRV